MQGLVYTGPGVMELQDVPRPTPGAGQVVVRVAYSGICGSELSGFLGHSSLRRPPMIFGHEFSGHIEASSPRSREHGWQEGDRVTANPLISCGSCAECDRGRQQLCPSRQLLGASLPGANADYVLVPERSLHRVPPGLSLATASMGEPAACAVHAVSRIGARPTDAAVVVGAGPIGLMLISVLQAFGLRAIFVVDPNPERLAIAVRMGATSAAVTEAPPQFVDLAFDAAGTEGARRYAVTAVRPGGRVAFVGLHVDETSLAINGAIRNELDLLGIFAYNHESFSTALRWLAEGRIGLAEGVVEADLADGARWFERLVDGAPVTKVLLKPVASQETRSTGES